MRELVRFFKFFYRLRGFTIVYLLLVIMVAALFETLGVSLFLPILEGGSLDNPVGQMLSSAFAVLHIEYSLTKVLFLMVFFFFLRAAFLMLKTCYVGKILSDLVVDLRVDTVRRLFETDYLYFLSKDTGYINNAVTVEFAYLGGALKRFVSILSAIIFSIMYVSLPLVLEPGLAVAILLLGVPAVLVIRKVNHSTKRYSIMTSKHSARFQSILIQALHHFKYLKATYSQDNVLSRIDSESKTLGHLRVKQALLEAITSDAFTPFTMLIVAGLLFYRVEVMGEEAASILFLLFLLQRATAQILSVQSAYRGFLVKVGSIKVYRTLEQELRENSEALKRGGAIPDFDQPIRFKNVAFEYPNGDYVLRDINLAIPPRSTIAFVGPSGSGKSTLVSLLTGILKPSQGQILLGGERYEDIDQELLRRGIGYVTQESVIFNDTIKNNITLWSESDSDERIEAAAAGADIRSFIETSPRGYDTLLGQSGLNISGGQRQRISIARELFKDIKLLIFDEATSSLDIDSEREIQKNIDDLQRQKTIVLVAHRLSTVRNSDIIFVLKDGRIIEQGSYDQLYHRNGEFRRIVDLQATSTREEEALSTV